MRARGANGGLTARNTGTVTPKAHAGTKTTDCSCSNGTTHITQVRASGVSGMSDDVDAADVEKGPLKANGSMQPSRHHMALKDTARSTTSARRRRIRALTIHRTKPGFNRPKDDGWVPEGAHPPLAFLYWQSGQGGQPFEPTFAAAEAVMLSNTSAVLIKTNHVFFIVPPFDRQSEACS